jgi:cyclic-di-AMP phosphodiesterase PgpH
MDRKIINFTIFIISALLLIMLFPKGGKFKYEYQKGKPWMHDVLVAPFDFPIYKPETDLNFQRDSILKNFPLYFNYNPKTCIEQKSRFRTFFANYWAFFNRRNHDTLKSELQYTIEQKILTLLDLIYKRGIIELPDDFNSISKQTAVIMIVRDNISEDSEVDDLFTQKRAYQYLIHQINVYSDNLSSTMLYNFSTFFNQLNLTEFIVPNLFYDAETSSRMRDSELENLSLTEGMVLTGERIIFTGDNVTPQAHKILESLKKEYELRMGKSSHYIFILLGQSILVVLCLSLLFIFLNKFRKDVLKSAKKTAYIMFIIVLFAFSASLTIKYKPSGLYMVPFAIVPILLRTFYDVKLALFVNIILIVLVGFWAPNGFEYVFLNIAAGMVALLSLTNLYRRNKLFITSAWLILTYIIIYTGLSLYQEGNLNNFNANYLLLFGGNGLLVLTSIPLIYIFEKVFGFLSEATMLELSDSNQVLLRKLAEIAPGTFQHSLQVANLSEEAIFKIGGNPLLVRVGSLYHDIGKIDNPSYFIENLSGSANPHENLGLDKSIEIILGHVNKGVEIAQKYRIPEQIIDFIRTHHGITKVQYFYQSLMKLFPQSKVDNERFSYNGPKPFSRELAVVMMADSVEAASRSLKSYTANDLDNLVERITSYLIKEEQLTESNFTLKDIEIVKSSFKKRLRNIYHNRIEYPG